MTLQSYAERGAKAGRAGHPDVSPILTDDPVAGRQAQATAFARILGGKERLEQMGLCLGIHAGPGIGYHEHHVISNRHPRTHLGIRRIRRLVVGSQQ